MSTKMNSIFLYDPSMRIVHAGGRRRPSVSRDIPRAQPCLCLYFVRNVGILF